MTRFTTAQPHTLVILTTVVMITISAPAGAASIEVDIPATTIYGNFFVNGEAATTSVYYYGNVFLRNPESDDQFLLGPTNDGSYVKNVVPGVYDVYYEHVLGDELVPQNASTIIGELTVPPPGEFSFLRHIDIPMTTLNGTFLINGETPFAGEAEKGKILAVDPYTQGEIKLGETMHGGFQSLEIIPGTYELYYEQIAGDYIPANERAFLGEFSVQATRDFVLPILVPEPQGGVLVGIMLLLAGFRRRRGIA